MEFALAAVFFCFQCSCWLQFASAIDVCLSRLSKRLADVRLPCTGITFPCQLYPSSLMKPSCRTHAFIYVTYPLGLGGGRSNLGLGDNSSSLRLGGGRSNLGLGDNRSSLRLGDNGSSIGLGGGRSNLGLGDNRSSLRLATTGPLSGWATTGPDSKKTVDRHRINKSLFDGSLGGRCSTS